MTGHGALLRALFAVPARNNAADEELLLDIGSGSGRVVAFAAIAGLRACGIELVAERHARAIAACARMAPQVAERLELRCEDALAATTPLDHATRVFCNNAIWPDALNARCAAHVAQCARRLVVYGTMKELQPDAADAAGLKLTRRSGVPVSWDQTGWPLYLYELRGAHLVVGEPVDDDAFHAAHESSTGFTMC